MLYLLIWRTNVAFTMFVIGANLNLPHICQIGRHEQASPFFRTVKSPGIEQHGLYSITGFVYRVQAVY